MKKKVVNQYKQYITNVHKQMTTSSKIIGEFVQTVTKHKVRSLKRLMLGESNEVYICLGSRVD